MKNKICIYHDNCNDGFLAATIVWRKYGEDCEYFPATYGEEPPDVTGKDVYIVDFSYKRDVLEKMNKQARSLMVLDHHKTAEEDLKDLPYCVFDMNKSGARLAWERFQGTFPIPEVVLCVEDRDLWLYNRPQTKKLHAYLGTLERKFSVWTILFDDDVLLHAAQYGEYILKYRDIKMQQILKTAGRIELFGRKVPIVNNNFAYSEVLNELAKGEPFAVGYSDDLRKWTRTFNLRSDKNGEDVSVLAKSAGGGGHRHAAGFTVSMGAAKKLVIEGDYIVAK